MDAEARRLVLSNYQDQLREETYPQKRAEVSGSCVVSVLFVCTESDAFAKAEITELIQAAPHSFHEFKDISPQSKEGSEVDGVNFEEFKALEQKASISNGIVTGKEENHSPAVLLQKQVLVRFRTDCDSVNPSRVSAYLQK